MAFLPQCKLPVEFAVAEGRITPGEGKEMTAMIDVLRRAIETEDLERRVAVLEQSAVAY